MTTVPIPAWNARGVIPPFDQQSQIAERSPYRVLLTDFVLRFSTSSERCNILTGFLNYRAQLHAVGLSQGFQWVDGSFLEAIETIESRPPKDIDIVTFFHLPVGQSQRDVFAAAPQLFAMDRVSKQALKTQFSVDAYMVDLGSAAEGLVGQSSYWYSLWSHRRDHTWKGYVQIDLAPTHDAQAQSLLQSQVQAILTTPAPQAEVPL